MWTRVRLALFGVALRAYPQAFRDRFGAEMRRDFAERPSVADVLRIAAAGFAERRAAAARWSLAPAHVPHLYSSSGSRLLDSAQHDIRHAIRSVRRAPVFTAVVASALALGIGSATTIFTVAYGILVRPLPYADSPRLVAVWSNDTNSHNPHNPVSPADFLEMQSATRTQVSLEGYFSFVSNTRLLADARAENIRTSVVGPGLFSLLGREAAVGRALRTGDVDQVVLSDGFWRRRFGGDPGVIGRRLVLDGQTFAVAGVMPADFTFPYKGLLGPSGFTDSIDVDLWMPMLTTDSAFADGSGQPVRSTRFLGVIGRLAAGTSLPAARAQVAGAAAVIERDHPVTNSGWTTTLAPLRDAVVGDVEPALLVLSAGVIVLLLMTSLNVANLMFARVAARRGELALRGALGAGRGRLVVQVLLECAVLTAIGGAAGFVVAWWGVKALIAAAPADVARLRELHVEPAAVAVWCCGVGCAAWLAMSWAPALVAARADASKALQETARGAVAPRARRRLQSAILVAEIALGVLLTIAAGLLIRSFDRVLAVDPGFRVDHVLTAQMNIPDRLTSAAARRAFYATYFERIRSIPGVVSAGATTRIPLGSTNVTTLLQVEGRPRRESELPSVEFRRALYDYFTTMAIPIVRGRAFRAADDAAAAPVAMVNRTLADRVFGREDPVGRRVRTGSGGGGAWLTIVGVVGDVRHSRLEAEPAPELYVNAVQNPPVAPFIAIRTAGNPADLAERLRQESHAIDPAMTLFDIRTMEDLHAGSLAARRFVLLLVSAFGLGALVIAVVGVYGVTSLIAVERTQEAGIRLALGATPRDVMVLIVRDGVLRAAVGAAAGVVVAAGVSPLLASQLYGVGPLDPLTFVATPCLLVAVAALASMVPGWRVMRVDPVRALSSQ